MTDQRIDQRSILARRPPGRLHALDRIVSTRGDGIPVTVEERILDEIRHGSFIDAAAGAAGIERSTFYDWLKDGASAHQKQARGVRLTASERRYATFASAVYEAEHDAETREVGGIYRLGVGGGSVTETTTVTDPDGKETVRVTVKELPPNLQAMAWHAERRWAAKWNRRQQIEVSGPEGGPIQVESPLADVMAQLDAMDRRQRSIDARSREVDDTETGDDG